MYSHFYNIRQFDHSPFYPVSLPSPSTTFSQMAPPTWTTDEERAFVFSKFQAFLAACSQGRAAQERWWDAFFPEWFSKFPTLGTLISRGDLPPDAVESTLTEEQKTMFGVEIQDKRKVRSWTGIEGRYDSPCLSSETQKSLSKPAGKAPHLSWC